MNEIEGMKYCLTHGGIMTAGTDYHPDGLGCQYPERESEEPCKATAMFYEPST